MGKGPRVRWIWLLTAVAFGVPLVVALPAGAQTSSEPTTDEVVRVTPPEDPTRVTITVEPKEILGIDEREQLFDIDVLLVAEWNDPRVDCQEDDARVFQGESANEQLKSNAIWWPGFHIKEGIGQRDTSALALTINCAEGARSIRYAERFVATVGQTFADLNNFPFDDHEIEFTIEPFSQANIERVRFTSQSKSERISTIKGIGQNVQTWESDEWNFGDVTSELANDRPSLKTTIPISRKAPWYWLSVIAPLMAIVALSWTVFWMKPDALSERMGISTTSLLTVVAFDFLTSDNLPKLAYTTRLDAFYNVSYVAVALTVAVSLSSLALAGGGMPRLVNLLARFRSGEGSDDDLSSEDRARTLDTISRLVFPVAYFSFSALAFLGSFSPGRGGFDFTPWSSDETPRLPDEAPGLELESDQPVSVTAVADLDNFESAFGVAFADGVERATPLTADLASDDSLFDLEGLIETSGDIDTYRMCADGDAAGVTVVVGSLDPVGQALDPLLAVYGMDGTFIASAGLDSDGLDAFDSVVDFEPERDACYLIAVADRELRSVGAYYLFGYTQFGGSFDFETDFGLSFDDLSPTDVMDLDDHPGSVASIAEVGEFDAYRICPVGTEPVTVDMWSIGEQGLDPLLLVYDENGAFVTSDDDSAGGLDSRLEILPEAGSCYVVIALDLSREGTGDYEISFFQRG